MAHHFQCTACGKCCFGQVPLTVDETFSHAGLFPLAMVWTPVREDSKDFARIAQIGAVFVLPNRKKLAALIAPSAYLPPAFACPALGADKLCQIHANKPLRCRAMPFYAYRDEQYQAELLKLQPGWECDISDTAPVVYDNQRITSREDFDAEKQALERQHPQIQRYADYMLKYNPKLLGSLAQAAQKAKAGQVVTSLSSFVTALRASNAKDIARQQLTVLGNYIDKTAHQKALTEFHDYYLLSAKEMGFMVSRG